MAAGPERGPAKAAGKRGTMERLRSFIRRDEGVTAVEYGLIAALIAVAIVGAVTTVGTNLNGIYQKVSNIFK